MTKNPCVNCGEEIWYSDPDAEFYWRDFIHVDTGERSCVRSDGKRSGAWPPAMTNLTESMKKIIEGWKEEYPEQELKFWEPPKPFPGVDGGNKV